ncbi:fork head domain-containing protein, partial [Mycotypha africana]|uniref:fork head domain-containing protein n=1 Tax=Mycotypha africana TaxID=64632 RepID=UPI0023017394
PPSQRPIRKRRRPPYSCATLIAQAILTSKHQRLTLREIYHWIQTQFPNLYEENEVSWQNTIRHNLSLNKCFTKLPRLENDKECNAVKTKGNKGGYWTVDLQQLNDMK